MPKKAADGTKPKKTIPESSRTLRSKGSASPIKKSDANDSAALEAERFLNLKSKPSAKPKVTKPKAAAEPKKRKAPAKAKADKEESPKKKMKKAGTMATTVAEGEKFVEKKMEELKKKRKLHHLHQRSLQKLPLQNLQKLPLRRVQNLQK